MIAKFQLERSLPIIVAAMNYYGCFPIYWQLVSGVERGARGKQKVVLSCDTSSPY